MKLLIIECGTSKLPEAIKEAAGKLIPKPESISTMNITLATLNVPELKNMLFHLAPNVIILDPPTEVAHNWNDSRWTGLLKEVIRHNEIMSGKLVLVSSVEVLGDAQPRTESVIPMPESDRALMLHSAEMIIEANTSRHYIMRFPHLAPPKGVESFTLITLDGIASTILSQVETGWFGKYHVSPNDFIMIYTHLTGKENIKVPDHTLLSRHTWKLAKSREVFIGCQANQ